MGDRLPLSLYTRRENMREIFFEIPGEAVVQGRPRTVKTFTGKTVLYDPVKSRDFKHYVELVDLIVYK